MSDEWTKEKILELLETNDKAVGRALVAIHKRQTESEKFARMTTQSNGVGFTSSDARPGSGMAEFFLKMGYLTPKQLAYWRGKNKTGRSRIGKYWNQLLSEAKRQENLKKST